MTTLLAVIYTLRMLNEKTIYSNMESWKTIQDGFFYRGIFFVLVAGLLIASLIFLFRRMLHAPKSSSDVEFSTVKQTESMNRNSAIVGIMLISFFFILMSLFQLTMALLLKIDCMQNLPNLQTEAVIVQSEKTLAGRILLVDHSLIFDIQHVITEPPMSSVEYRFSYLKNSHILTDFRELP